MKTTSQFDILIENIKGPLFYFLYMFFSENVWLFYQLKIVFIMIKKTKTFPFTAFVVESSDPASTMLWLLSYQLIKQASFVSLSALCDSRNVVSGFHAAIIRG